MKKILLIALFSSSLFFISTEVNAADNREDISIGKGFNKLWKETESIVFKSYN